jgi:competence protein ComFA
MVIIMIENLTELYGRQINSSLISAHITDSNLVRTKKSIEVYRNYIHCKRCGQNTQYFDAFLPDDNYYCPHCINLGRVSLKDPLCFVPEPNDFVIKRPILTWKGHLTSEQFSCAQKIIQVFNKHQRHLLWAVTGAGKTEMLFYGLEDALNQHKRICIASPRIDVCIELYPRIKSAFANTSICLLHGRSMNSYKYCQLTICTTHQLLRFYAAFDVLIIDEVDSFPFVNNPILYYASQQAVKKDGSTLYLTATPSKSLLKEIKHNKIGVSYLPIRFHRHLLPQIKVYYVQKWRRQLQQGKLPTNLIKKVRAKIYHQQRFLLFVPRINDLELVSKILKRYFDSRLWTTVYSSDEERLDKVEKMRQQQFLFLITTTILERGVTFPGIDVLVLGADDEVFSASSLVQIAGRVGRKVSRPFGDVSFYSDSNTKSIKSAIQQIKYMNRLAKKLHD